MIWFMYNYNKKKITVTFDQNLFQFFRWNKKKAVGKLLMNVFR